MTHYENAMSHLDNAEKEIIEFGREARLAIELEGKTIRDFSVDRCGNTSMEDRIGRHIMAAEFVDELSSVQYGNVRDWLTPTHYTELRKIEQATDKDTALEYMQDLITELPDGTVDVKPVTWLRAKRDNETSSDAEIYHRFWKSAARALLVMQSAIERKGKLLTARDKKMLALLKAAVRLFQAEPEGERT